MKDIKKEIKLFRKKKQKLDKIKRTTWTPNDIIYYRNYAEVVTREAKTQNINGVFKIDLEDISRILDYKWRNLKGYAAATTIQNGNKMTTKMSRFIMYCYDNKLEVDHINRDKSDNRKYNLRIVTHRVNSLNRTPIRDRPRFEVKIK